MKLNIRALYLALLGVGLLLLFNAASAQRQRSVKQQEPKAQTPTPQPPTPEGSYTLDDPAAATKTINEAIEVAVKGTSVFVKGRARDILKEKNLPPPHQIVISYTPTEVSIATERTGPIQTPVNGTFVDRSILGEQLKVNTQWKDGKLQRTFKGGGGGQQVNTYCVSADGKALLMLVTVTGSRFLRPLVYDLPFTRTGADKHDIDYNQFRGCSRVTPDKQVAKDKQDFDPVEPKQAPVKGNDKQDADFVRLKQLTAKAESDVKASFAKIEPKIITLIEANGASSAYRVYNQQDIIRTAQIEKNKFVQGIEGKKFAALRAYAENSYPIPSQPDFETMKYEGRDYTTERSKKRASVKSITFIRKIASLLEPGERKVNVTINSEPQMADFEMSAGEGNSKTTTTNSTIDNVYRGLWNYTLSKDGYKTIHGVLDLVDGGSRLECTLDKDKSHVCKQLKEP